MLKSLDFAEDSLTMISTEAKNKEAAERQQDRAAFVSNALGETWPKWRRFVVFFKGAGHVKDW